MNRKIAAVLMLGALAGPLSAAEKLTVVSFGGNNRQAQEKAFYKPFTAQKNVCLLYTSPSPRDATLSRMPSSA